MVLIRKSIARIPHPKSLQIRYPNSVRKGGRVLVIFDRHSVVYVDYTPGGLLLVLVDEEFAVYPTRSLHTGVRDTTNLCHPEVDHTFHVQPLFGR